MTTSEVLDEIGPVTENDKVLEEILGAFSDSLWVEKPLPDCIGKVIDEVGLVREMKAGTWWYRVRCMIRRRRSHWPLTWGPLPGASRGLQTE